MKKTAKKRMPNSSARDFRGSTKYKERVVGWGYYYLITVMDDCSRYILAWELKRDMTANSLVDVIQQAVDITGMSKVPVKDRNQCHSFYVL